MSTLTYATRTYMGKTHSAVLYNMTPRPRFTDEEKDRHENAAINTQRGGTALLLGARGQGRWDPACSCGWRESSNEGRAAADEAWRDHRRGAVTEERALANGEPIFRVLVTHNPEGKDLIYEWRGLLHEDVARKRAENETFHHARVQRSTDGEHWETI